MVKVERRVDYALIGRRLKQASADEGTFLNERSKAMDEKIRYLTEQYNLYRDAGPGSALKIVVRSLILSIIF